jgi:hypothetical protein
MRAVTPGPEPLDALLLAAALFFLIRFANEGGAKNLYFGMGAFGLSLANNLLMLFLIPVVFLFVRVVHPPLIRNLGVVRFRGLMVFAAGASISLAVAARGWYELGFVIPEQQKSWLRFWDHMMLAWDQPLQESLIRFGSMLLLNFPPWSIVIGLIGLAELNRRQKYVFWLIFPLFLIYSALAVTLHLPEPVPSYLPAWVFFSVAVGYGWWKLLSSGNWQGFAIALVLSASPLAIYRFAPLAVRRAQMELRVEALLDVPKSSLDHLASQLNPTAGISRKPAGSPRGRSTRFPTERGSSRSPVRRSSSSRPSPTSSKWKSTSPRASWSLAKETRPASERSSPSPERSSRWGSILRIRP